MTPRNFPDRTRRSTRGAGPRAQQEFGRLLRAIDTQLAKAGEPVRELDDLVIELLVGGIASLATNRVAQGETATLPDLLDAIEAFVLANFGLPLTA
jgi:hypothetical protein